MATEYTDTHDWKTEAPLLAAMDIKNPFAVPAGYFDGLTEAVEARILGRQPGIAVPDLSVPENYFDTLGRDIETRIAAERLKEQVNADGFTVPGTYFEDLKYAILAKTTNKKQPFVRKLAVHWVRYAAAACITIAIGTGAYLNWPQNSSYQEQISSLSDEEIIQYLQQHPAEIDNQLLMNIDPALIGTEATENAN